MTFALSALAAASVVYWGLKVWGLSTPAAPSSALVEPMSAVSSQAIARALGGGMAAVATASTAAPAASRYDLIGVVAGRIRAGAALISVDGQDAKPVRVGNLVDNEMVLESVNGRQAVLSSSTGTAAKLTLEMPKLTQ
ncbi:general secretion pathway protein C [Polaromonas glacialis]|uniref:general secretion pathway protein C n=1 Tax=Polaromonas glacialis TaxID=866564 RepID=UPI000AD42693|nr:general secretion pathway protein C [Polaromonas glacialis]